MRFEQLLHRGRDDGDLAQRVEPRIGPVPVASEVFDTGRRTIIDCAHVRVERLATRPVLYSKVFKEFQDRNGQKYDYRYWSERENFFLREFLKKQNLFAHVVQPRHLISENDAAMQVLTCDAGVTVANWLRVKARYADTATLSNPFQRSDALLQLLRGCLVALKEIHSQRIVHCDIKEDNICIPYAPYPFRGGQRGLTIDFGRLKLIDFAFSVAHEMPLSQILVIDPDERLPYQSARLIAALQEDRRSGCPNAVQALDYGVDLFSLGYMVEKISAAGLDRPAGAADDSVPEGIRRLVSALKSYDEKAAAGPLPHDELIADIDRLLVQNAAGTASAEFVVDGEWSTEDMARSSVGRVRHTPSTPVALPPPTPVAPPFARPARPRRPTVARASLLAGVALAFAAGTLWYALHTRQADAPAGTGAAKAPEAAVQAAPAPDHRKRIASLLRSEEEREFQSAFGELAQLMERDRPAAAALTESVAAEYGETLASATSRSARARAMNRLVWMTRAGDGAAARQVASFEKGYDSVKQAVARSEWWSRGRGERPDAAVRWMEDGELLAQHGDRPAMLDVAYALGHGRSAKRDRLASLEAYLKVIDRSSEDDPSSARIRRAAVRGLGSLLNSIVEQKDEVAARSVLPVLEPRAAGGAADLQYFAGLINECALNPANLSAARAWYRKAAAAPDWKELADRKDGTLGRWCPGPPAAGT